MNFVFDLITSTSRAKTIECNYLVVSANLDHELVVAQPKGFSLRCFSCKGEIFSSGVTRNKKGVSYL